jgi:hypothetical protein
MDGLVAGWLILAAIGIAVGAAIGRWPAGLLALVLPLAATTAGEGHEDVQAWLLVLILWTPPAAAGLLLWVAWRKQRRRRSGPGRSAALTPH